MQKSTIKNSKVKLEEPIIKVTEEQTVYSDSDDHLTDIDYQENPLSYYYTKEDYFD